MISALNIAATGMSVAVDEINTVANNLSNLQTTSFKSMMVVSSDLKYNTRAPSGLIRADGGEGAPTGVQFGSGTKTAATFRIIKQGDIKSTGDPLHLAISGSGYFKVRVGDKDCYTRAGSFRRNAQTGLLVTSEGYVVGDGIEIPEKYAKAKLFNITSKGELQYTDDEQQNPETFAQLELFTFPNESALDAIGDNLFLPSEGGSGFAIPGIPGENGVGTLEWHSLEQSTVDAVEELTHAIAAQRAYELMSKMIKISDEMMSSANQVK